LAVTTFKIPKDPDDLFLGCFQDNHVAILITLKVGFDFGGEALDLGQHFLEPTGEQMTGIDFVVVIILDDSVFESAMQPRRNAELTLVNGFPPTLIIQCPFEGG
jgi:hypothetical protein